VNFTYVEDAIRSLQTFTSFVQRHRPLFEALDNNFKLIFVSNSAQSFQPARDIFLRNLSATQRGQEKQRLARFFWLRRMAEEKRFRELAHKDVVEWQRGLKQYSGPEYESQYQSWKQAGKLAELEPQSLIRDPRQQFETFLVMPNVVRPGSLAASETAQPAAQLTAHQQPT
jgi:hypothetical protein